MVVATEIAGSVEVGSAVTAVAIIAWPAVAVIAWPAVATMAWPAVAAEGEVEVEARAMHLLFLSFAAIADSVQRDLLSLSDPLPKQPLVVVDSAVAESFAAEGSVGHFAVETAAAGSVGRFAVEVP